MKLEPIKESIISMYVNDNLSTVDIANKIGASPSGVERLLRKNNVEITRIKHVQIVPDDQRQKMTEMYKSGMTTREIGKVFGVSDKTVSKIVRKNGVEIRRAVRRSCVKNHDFFREIDTPEKAYFLGWMITDGSVVEHGTRKDRSNTVSIEIIDGDRYILEMFAECLGATKDAVHTYEKRNHAHFRFSSKEMCDDLAKYGVVPRKTWISYLPDVREDLTSHLLRGAFDGNGTFTAPRNYPRVGMYGSDKICNQFCDIFNKELGLHKGTVSKSTCYYAWWNGRSAITKIYEYLYRDCGEYYLKRKKEKFEKFIIE